MHIYLNDIPSPINLI